MFYNFICGWAILTINDFFKINAFSQCCLTFSSNASNDLLQMLLNNHYYAAIFFLFSIFFPCLSLGLFKSYICDLLLIFTIVFIVINHIMSLKQTHWFFLEVLEYLLLFLDDNMDEENESFFQYQMFCLRVLLSFCLFFCQFQPSFAYKSVAQKKACISIPGLSKKQLEPLRCKNKLKFLQ